MTDYAYDDKWSTKNALADSAALKVVDADEFHTEFGLIETAVNTKSNKASNLSDLTDKPAAIVNLGFTGATTNVASTSVANEYTKTQNFNATGLTDGATIAWDSSVHQVCSVTLAGNRTMAAPTNQVDGGFYHLTILQDGSGSRTMTWNAVFKWPSDTAPTLTTTASQQDELTFRSNGTNMYLVGQSLAVA